MSNFITEGVYKNNQDSNIVIRNNRSITSIDLKGNRDLTNLEVYNCPNLKEITFNNFDNLQVKVGRCNKLNIIDGTVDRTQESYTGNSFTLSKGCNNINYIMLSWFEKVIIHPTDYANLEELYIYDIAEFDFDLAHFPNLREVEIIRVSNPIININSDNLESIEVNECICDELNFNGDNSKLESISINHFVDPMYIEFKNPLTEILEELSISMPFRKFPRLPLPDKANEDFVLSVDIDETRYHISLKHWIEKNQHISLYSNNYGSNCDDQSEIELDYIKFYRN